MGDGPKLPLFSRVRATVAARLKSAARTVRLGQGWLNDGAKTTKPRKPSTLQGFRHHFGRSKKTACAKTISPCAASTR
jgi:hypothetical protein